MCKAIMLERTPQEFNGRTFRELFPTPEIEKHDFVWATDMEGPQVLGDAVAEVMSAKVRPESASTDGPDYGGILYAVGYDWYTDATLGRRRTFQDRRPQGLIPLHAQEGTDTVFTLAPFLATGVDEQFIHDVSMQYKRTPGADSLVSYLKSEGALALGITTALEKPYKDIARQIGLDGLVGTPFPLDQARERLVASGRFDEEIGMVRGYLEEAYTLIDEMHNASTPEQRKEWEAKLRERVGLFHESELGISYDPLVRKQRGEHKTLIGKMIEEQGVVGDRSKAAIATALFKRFAHPDSLTVTIGDGTNDRDMLGRGKFSIAFNGGPVDFAKVVVITPDARTLIPLIDILRHNPTMDLDKLIQEVRHAVGSYAIITRGGVDVPQDIRDKGKQMKKVLRGAIATLVP